MKTSKLIIYANYLYFIICVLVGIGTQSFIQNHRPHVFWNSELSGSSDKLSTAHSVPDSPTGSGVARCTISHIHTCVGGSQDLVVVWGLAGRTHKTCT